MKVLKGSVWVRLNNSNSSGKDYKEGALLEASRDGFDVLHYNGFSNTAEISKFRKATNQEKLAYRTGVKNVSEMPFQKGTVVVRTKKGSNPNMWQQNLGAIFECKERGHSQAYYSNGYSTSDVRLATDAEIKAFKDGVKNISGIGKPPTPATPEFKYKVGDVVVRTEDCSSKHAGIHQIYAGAMWECVKDSHSLAYYANHSGSGTVRHANKREVELYQSGVRNINEKLKNGHFYKHSNGSIIRWNSNIDDAEWAIPPHNTLIKEGSYLNDLSQFYVPSPEEIAWLKNSISRGYVVGDRPKRKAESAFYSDTTGVHIHSQSKVVEEFKWDTPDAPNIQEINPTDFDTDVYVKGLDPVNSQFDASAIQKRLEGLSNGGLEKKVREEEYEKIMNQLMGGYNPYSDMPHDYSVAMGLGIVAQIENANKSKVKRKIPGLIEVKDRR